MFRKTRRKIIFTVVLSLLALLTVTLTTIYLSNRAAMRRTDEEMLETYVERYSIDGQAERPEDQERPDSGPIGQPDDLPPEPPDGIAPNRDEPRFRLSTFYSVAYGTDGEVLAVQNGNDALQSEESLLAIAGYAVHSGKPIGSKGNIRYLVSDCGDYTLVAMIDSTIGDDSQQVLFREMLAIGSAAMIVLFVLSVFIARRIVRPLEENDQRQKRFISDAGHELKTPIAVISTNSELLKRQIGENEWLSNIDYENERMSDLVRQLLVLSKAENGQMPKEPIDFSKLVDGEALPFESVAFEKDVRIDSEIEPGITVDGNPNQLRQLVSILLDNALSHGTGDMIALSLHRERHTAALTVSNDAEEMNADQLSHLFDRFYRTDEARGETDSHYGLGLSIAQAVVEAHGGQIQAEYRKPRAVFTVTLPVKKTEKP